MHDRHQTEVLEEGSQLKWRYAIQTHLSHVINSKMIPTNLILMGGGGGAKGSKPPSSSTITDFQGGEASIFQERLLSASP